MFDIELIRKRQREIGNEVRKAIDKLSIYLNLYSNISPKVDLLITLVQQNSEFFNACPNNCSLERIYKKLESLIEENEKKEIKNARKHYLIINEIFSALSAGKKLEYQKSRDVLWLDYIKPANWQDDVSSLTYAGALFRYKVEMCDNYVEKKTDPRKYLDFQEVVNKLKEEIDIEYQVCEGGPWYLFTKDGDWRGRIVNLAMLNNPRFRLAEQKVVNQVPDPTQTQNPKEKIYGWANLYSDLKHNQIVTSCLYESKDVAYHNRDLEGYITTVKLCYAEPAKNNSQNALGTKPA